MSLWYDIYVYGMQPHAGLAHETNGMVDLTALNFWVYLVPIKITIQNKAHIHGI